jgi:hypothetical protein
MSWINRTRGIVFVDRGRESMRWDKVASVRSPLPRATQLDVRLNMLRGTLIASLLLSESRVPTSFNCCHRGRHVTGYPFVQPPVSAARNALM